MYKAFCRWLFMRAYKQELIILNKLASNPRIGSSGVIQGVLHKLNLEISNGKKSKARN